MEFKTLLVISMLGLAAGFTVPAENTQPQSTDLESSFPSSYTDKLSPLNAAEPLSPEENIRDKRGLFKKWKKGGGETIVVNRNYEQSGLTGTGHYRQREVHHHHHYSNPPPVAGPTYVEQHYQPAPIPNNEYYQYHGHQNQGSYYGGGYSAGAGAYASGSTYQQKPGYSYGDGGYAHYGGAGGYGAPPAHLAAPIASNHNNVDRGQGAAAVNNIAIIHARAGSSSSSSSSSSSTSDSKVLPRPLPVDVDEMLSREGYGFD